MPNRFVKHNGSDEVYLIKEAIKCTYSCEYMILHGGGCSRELYTLMLVSPSKGNAGGADSKFLEPIERQCSKDYVEVKSW